MSRSGAPWSHVPGSCFFDADLEEAKPPRFAHPAKAEPLVESLKSVRMLVLAGREFEDKTLLASHLAWCLLNEMGRGSAKRWHFTSTALDVDEITHGIKGPTVLIFPGIHPYQFGHDLRRLHQIVTSRLDLYAILTTDSAREAWRSGELLDEALWKDLETEEIYDEDHLFACLKIDLHVNGAPRLETALFPKGHDHLELPVAGSITIRQSLRQLKTPGRVRSFLAVLRCQEAAVAEDVIRNSLNQAASVAVNQWYGRLDKRQQCLAMGLALLHGLFRDQALAALDVILTDGWKARVPGLEAFDYHELPAISEYFRGTATSSGNPPVEVVSQQHRIAILSDSWELHRRLMTATMPILATIVIEAARYLPFSSASQSEDRDKGDPKEGEETRQSETKDEARLSGWQAHGPARDLFGSPSHLAQIFRAVSEALSLVGILSFEAVEPTLLQLATHPDPAVQSVSASAIAKWRGFPEDLDTCNLFFNTLARWQDESSLIELMHRLNGSPTAELYANVRSTVAIAVSFGALYDECNHLEPRLVALFKRLFEDHSKVVARAFRLYTLRFVAGRHFHQMEDFLRSEVAPCEDLQDSLAAGIADAMAIQPKHAREVIDRWCDCQSEAFSLPTAPSSRETTLAVVALGYGYASRQDREGGISGKEIFSRLKDFLRLERSTYIRRSVLRALVLQASRDPAEIETELQEMLDLVAADPATGERNFIMKGLTEVYLSQRHGLKGGDGILLNGPEPKIYHIWRNPALRPRTEIELVLRKWCVDGKRAASQIATRTLASLGGTWLEKEERRPWKQARSRPKPELPDGPRKAPSIIKAVTEAELWGRAAAWLSTLFAPSLRTRVLDLFAEVLASVDKEGGSSVDMERQVSDFMRRIKEGAEAAEAGSLDAIEEHLQRAALIYRNQVPVITGTCVLLISLSVWIVLSLR